MMYNFLTICVGDRYGAEYPNAIHRMVHRNFSEPFQFFCLTDNDDLALEPGINRIKPTHDLVGWWNKMYLYSPLMPEGRLIYLDLDIVIVNDITSMITGYTGDFCGDEDPIHWGYPEYGKGLKWPEFGKIDCSLGTAVVSMKAHSKRHIWDDYLSRRDRIETAFKVYGDQCYVQSMLKDDFDLFERLYPDSHGICSYKFDILGKMPRHLEERMHREEGVILDPRKQKIINFHGNPKPFEEAHKYYWLQEALK